MPAPIAPAVKKKYRLARKEGESMAEAARTAGVSYAWAKAYEHDLKNDSGDEWRAMRERKEEAFFPFKYDELSDEARLAYDDIAYFALRYYGAIVLPWQLEATRIIVEKMHTPQREYVCINCPPGAGKSTFFSRILPAWLTVRNRGIRGMIVSSTQGNAEDYTTALRRWLEETLVIQAREDDLAAGIAVDAESTLIRDFGPFKPPAADGERWTAKAFQVMQPEGVPIREKEPTWTAFGQGATWLGKRLNIVICDDVFVKSKVKTMEARKEFMEWYDDQVETRLEPNGLLVLIGQRQSADDVYRHCLDKKILIDLDGEDIESEVDAPSKYTHVIFKAHYDELCTGDHKDVKPYPEGCLLYPKRISWRDLRSLDASVREVAYQQQDVAAGDVLVQRIWVDGGKDPATGIEYFGCLDRDRDEWEVPDGLSGHSTVYATADPSPSNFWSIQCWLVHEDTKQRFLLAHKRKRMQAPELLDWKIDEQRFVGIMDEWQNMSELIGHPILYWIVEDNAAQKFLLQYDYAQKWRSARSVEIVRHNTNWSNKSDAKLGIESIGPLYKQGKVRLPYAPGGNGRLGSLQLIDEVTKWPDGRTDDAVMAQWFLEWNYPRLYMPPREHAYSFARPGWMKPNGSPLRSVPA